MSFGQLIQVGPPDPHYCDKIEQIKPNLILSRTTDVSGTITDQTGAFFVNSLIELRLYESESRQISVKKVQTDRKGHFDLGTVTKGRYRLLASSARAFKQAAELECGDHEKCVLLITLQVNPTDQPDSICPVK